MGMISDRDREYYFNYLYDESGQDVYGLLARTPEADSILECSHSYRDKNGRVWYRVEVSSGVIKDLRHVSETRVIRAGQIIMDPEYADLVSSEENDVRLAVDQKRRYVWTTLAKTTR